MSTPAVTPEQFQYIKLPDGSYGRFRADASDDQIRSAISKDFPSAFPQPQKPAPAPGEQATISAQPKGVLPWLNNLEQDVRYGGQSTGLGKFLHAIGMQGINRGVSGDDPAIATPITGPIHAAQGAAMIPSHPIQGALRAGSGLLETATLPTAFVAPEGANVAATAAGEGTTEAGNLLARLLRRPATAAQSQSGYGGSLNLPRALRAIVPEQLVPKGEVGTLTNPGPFMKLPMKVAEEPKIGATMPLVVRPATDLQAVQQAEQGFETAAKPAGRLVLTPQEATAEDRLSAIAKTRAKQRGMQFAGGMVPREGRKVPWRPTVLPPDE